MSRIRRIRVVALAVPIALGVVAGTALADPVLVEAMGLDVWHIGQLERDLQRAKGIETQLDRELQVVLDRAAVHDQILDDLVSGRLALVEAARQKWKMNRGRSVLVDHLERQCFGPTFEAKMAHDLYMNATTRIGISTETLRELRTRLSREYREAYGVEIPGQS